MPTTTPFTFTGKFNKVTLSIDHPKLTPADIQKIKDAEAKAAAAKE
jgi:arylsulfatase